MSTSATDFRLRAAKTALVYLVVTIACALFGAIYELFSHEVYSFYMIYAFAFPLCGGVAPYLLLSLPSKLQKRDEYDRLTGHAGIATLTVGSLISGILEIYGTTNRWVLLYWPVGALLVLCSFFQVSKYFIPDKADDIENINQYDNLLPPCSFAKEWILKTQVVDADADNAICYELALTDENGKSVSLPENSVLILPYPTGITAEDAEEYEFVVINRQHTGVDIYSTQNKILKRTKCGLELTIPSVSPFGYYQGAHIKE